MSTFEKALDIIFLILPKVQHYSPLDPVGTVEVGQVGKGIESVNSYDRKLFKLRSAIKSTLEAHLANICSSHQFSGS